MIPVILSITVHEFSHAYVSNRLGDDTAKIMGRMTLNPLAHIDLFGTIIIPAIGILSGVPFFGWAKPVPFNPLKFRRSVRMKHGALMVAIAGPISNFMLALFVVAVVRIFDLGHSSMTGAAGQISSPLLTFMIVILNVNVSLAIFNLLPIPPLDGSKILYGILPDSMINVVETLEKYSFILFILLLLFGGRLIGPPIYALLRILYTFMFN